MRCEQFGAPVRPALQGRFRIMRRITSGPAAYMGDDGIDSIVIKTTESRHDTPWSPLTQSGTQIVITGDIQEIGEIEGCSDTAIAIHAMTDRAVLLVKNSTAQKFGHYPARN